MREESNMASGGRNTEYDEESGSIGTGGLNQKQRKGMA